MVSYYPSIRRIIEKSSNGSVVQPKALIAKLVELNLHFQRSARVTVRCVARCAALKKDTALGLFCDSDKYAEQT